MISGPDDDVIRVPLSIVVGKGVEKSPRRPHPAAGGRVAHVLAVVLAFYADSGDVFVFSDSKAFVKADKSFGRRINARFI